MQKTVVKYSITFLFLLVYINRGIFITPYEIENQNGKEVNSLIELVLQLITGKDNGIDEDGDCHSSCDFVKIVQHDFLQQISKNFELTNLYLKNIEKFGFSRKENFSPRDFYTQIDHPPQKII